MRPSPRVALVATLSRRCAPLALLLAAPALAQAPPAPGAVDLNDPTTCAPCHATVVAEWQESMHAQAHHARDPVYAGLRRIRIGKEGPGVAKACQKCHTPRAAGPEDDSPAARHGVSCATCHNTAHVKPQGVGTDRLVPFEDPTTLQGPNAPREGMIAPHGLGGPPPPQMLDGMSLCLACHENLANPKGAVLCNTGEEFGDVGGAYPGQRCVDCHMPIVEGPSGAVDRDQAHASHKFVGPHRRWQHPDALELPEAVVAEGQLDRQLTITLKNVSGHGWPSGFPGRMAVLKLVGHDAAGAVTWTNFKADPLAESPQSVLNKIYVDAAGKPTLPPYSERLQRDTRLRPGESRRLTYPVPAAVARVEASLLYRLVPPPLVEAFQLQDLPEAEPRPILRLTIQR